MSTFSRLSEVYKRSMEIPFDNSSKFVFFSDCHRGDGSLADDFNRNQNIFYSALKHYYANEFTYFDLGDSDELWKNKKFSKISTTHSDTFRLIREFYNAGRFFIYKGLGFKISWFP